MVFVTYLYGFCNNSVILVNNSVIDATRAIWYYGIVRRGRGASPSRTGMYLDNPTTIPTDRPHTARAATPAHSAVTVDGTAVYI